MKTFRVQVFLFIFFAATVVLNAVTSSIMVFVKFWMNKIVMKRFCGFKMTYSMTPLLEMDFDLFRMTSYVPHIIKATDNLVQYEWKMRSADELLGEMQFPTDDVFVEWLLLRTPMAFYTEDKNGKYTTDMSTLKDLDNFDDTYYDIEKIVVDKATKKITFYSIADGPITDSDEAAYNRAKMAAIACITYFVPGVGHSWVHFLFPDAMGAAAFNTLPRKSVLYKLLEPHMRFTNRINWEALGVRGPLVIGGSTLVRMAAEATTAIPRGQNVGMLPWLFEPIAPFSVSAHEFVRKNSERTTEYYFGEEFSCPPKWFDSPTQGELPYIKSIKRFYPILREHVTKALAFEDKATIDAFIAEVEKISKVDDTSCLRLDRFDPIDVITTFIFDGAFIHSTDHYFLHRALFETRYGIASMRIPTDRTWFPGSRVPDDMCDSEDRIRTDGFGNTFVRFNDSNILSNSMKYLKYKFRQPELRNAGPDLIAAIKAEQEKMDADGDIYTPIEKLSRSICF